MRHAEPVGFCGRGRRRSLRARVCSPARTEEQQNSKTANNSKTAKETHNTHRTPWGFAAAGQAAGSAAGRDHPAGACRSAVAVITDPGGEAMQDIRMMGAWWMPWRWRPRKDAATRRNAPGRRWQPAIRGCPNGATRPAHGRAPEATQEGTGGTETSQYPEEQRGFP